MGKAKDTFSPPLSVNKLLLHTCCAPCACAIIEKLLDIGIKPTIFYFNPNIHPKDEYLHRKDECLRYAQKLGLEQIDGDYDHKNWLECVRGFENEPERSSRCQLCFNMRLLESAKLAKQLSIELFTTTLASSRWKNLEQITRAGELAESATGVHFWAQNWRKGGLQQRRNELLKANNFYNQQFCGCEFSTRKDK